MPSFHRKTVCQGLCCVSAESQAGTSGGRKIHPPKWSEHTWSPSRSPTSSLSRHRPLQQSLSTGANSIRPTDEHRLLIPQFAFSATNLPHHYPTITMKFFFALAALAIATVSADPCDLTKVLPLLKDANVIKCSADTGFSPPTPPDAATLPKLCSNDACKAALATLNGLGLGDCTIGTTRLITDLTGPIQAFCEKTPAPATTTAAPSTPSTPGTTPSASTPSAATPAPATTKPVC